jgi:predicted nucleotidyltransferase
MKNIRYPYNNNPFGFKLPEQKPFIHPVIKKWDDFSEEDKKTLSEIKRIIVSYIGECRVVVFGSRIKGNWDEESDWDLIVITDVKNSDLLLKVRNHTYKVETDIKFSDKFIDLVEIQW